MYIYILIYIYIDIYIYILCVCVCLHPRVIITHAWNKWGEGGGDTR